MPITSVTGGGAYIPDNEPTATATQPSQIPTDRPKHQDIPVTKRMDQSSPALLNDSVAPAPLTDPITKAVILEGLQPNTFGGTGVATTARNPTIDKPAASSKTSSTDLPQESVGFVYEKLEVTYSQQTQANGSDTPGTVQGTTVQGTTSNPIEKPAKYEPRLTDDQVKDTIKYLRTLSK